MVPGAQVRTEFGDVGIVRFRGLTTFREGEWVGIELARPKGKNGGTVLGTAYFTCAPQHGLFARPAKLELLPADAPLSTSDTTDLAAILKGSGGGVPPASVLPASVLPASVPHLPLEQPSAHMSAPTSGERKSPRTPSSAERRMAEGRWPAPETRPTLTGMPTSKGTLEYALNGSPWPERSLPHGWREAWGAAPPLHEDSGSGGSANAAESGGTVHPLPVVVYVSSLTGDRRATKNSRWAVDFLTGKKVPHAIVDLSVHPHLRTRLVQQLALASPGRGSQLSTRRAEEAIQLLPVIDLGGVQTVSAGEMQDFEDHGELDPLLQRVILEYADKIARPPPAVPPSPNRAVAALCEP